MVNMFSKFQVPSSYSLGGKMILRSGGKGSGNKLISNKGVCITAPAIWGLLNTSFFTVEKFKRNVGPGSILKYR